MFSIIIPIYNAEKTINKTVDSILDQSYQKFELILINDGSLDSSLEIIKKYKDERIVHIHKKNSGVSDTRNQGILLAKNKYVLFVDSDDYLAVNCLEIIKNKITDSKLLIYGYNTFINNKIISQKTWEEFIPNEKKYQAIFSLIKNVTFNQVWNKVYIRDILIHNKILFNQNFNIGEDLIFNLEYIQYVSGVDIVSDHLYFYNIENQNLTRKYRQDSFEIHLVIAYIYRDKLSENKVSLKDASNFMVKSFYGYVTMLYENKVKDKSKLIKLKLQNPAFKTMYQEKYKNDFTFYKTLKFILRHKLIVFIKIIGYMNYQKARNLK